MRRLLPLALLACVSFASAERINHAGRILGATPTLTAPVQFNTASSDSVLGTLQIFPRDNPWNEDVSRRPRLSNSDAMIAKIKSELLSSRQTLRAFFEMNFCLVPNNQPLVSLDFVDYPDQSDPSPYPIPTLQPVETWPRETGTQTLDDWQRDVLGWGGDRHSITLQPNNGNLFETWQMIKTPNDTWQASNGAKFNINSNALRPYGWTSGDAAGFPMFPALVRYDEVKRGRIEHALRLVVKHTRLGPIYPARHHASVPATSDPNVPAMGQRLRLKSSFIVPATWTKEEKLILEALKKYGGMVSDNGNFFSFSVTPDNRWPDGCFDHLKTIDVNNFEVIQTTGATEGPRSPNAPTANAGADITTTMNTQVSLNGVVGGGTTAPLVTWYRYSGPVAVTFTSTSTALTKATFSQAGIYTLMLRSDDRVHTPAYDAVVVRVQ
ncbi:MAG: hypothetical protein ABL949_04085 [Fimbriimonadaceae bacterium]